MKQLEVFNRIGGIIKELNDQYKYIEANPADLNELELELFVANAHFLADHADILIKLNLKNKAQNIPEQKETTVKEKYFEPVVRQIKPEAKTETALSETNDEHAASIDLSSDTPEDTYSFIRQEPEVIRHELVVDNDSDTEEETTEEEETVNEEIADEEKPAETILAAKEEKEIAEEPVAVEDIVIPASEEAKPAEEKQTPAKDEVLTINQKISSQLGNKGSITEQLNGQAVTNLKQAITLNDKLLYIKDLFNGYSLAYSEAIEILNRFNNFEEAERFLNKNYVAKNSWESKPETTAKFYALLKRRYS